MTQRVALVTGSNRGIGLEVVRQLAEKDFKVILSSRDENKGIKAMNKLKKDNVYFHQLDTTDVKSIKRSADHIEKKFGRLDVLVNNAGILIDGKKTGMTVDPETMKKTLETNTYGPLFVSQAFIPLMKKNKYGRIVNVSSGLGQLDQISGGYPSYSISKTALNAVTRVLAGETQGHNILVNSVCPGWVKTDMGGSGAERSIEKGAETLVWLAILPDKGPTGKFFRDKKEIEW